MTAPAKYASIAHDEEFSNVCGYGSTPQEALNNYPLEEKADRLWDEGETAELGAIFTINAFEAHWSDDEWHADGPPALSMKVMLMEDKETFYLEKIK